MLRSATGKLALVTLLAFSSFSSKAQNQALDLSGAGNEVNVTYSLTTGPGFTVEQWIYIPALTQNTSLVNQTNTNLAAPLDIYVQADGAINLWSGDGTTTNNVVSATGLITSNTWHHVAVVFDPTDVGNERKVFVDGVITPAISAAVTTPMTSIGPIRIGRRADAFEGDDIYIDEVRIWSTPKDAAAINASYNQELIGNESNLDVYLRFENDLDDDAFVNLSQNGSLVAGSINYVAGPPIQTNNYALAFEGTDDYLTTDNAVAKQLNQGTIEAWVNASSATAVDWSGVAVKQLAYGMFVRSDVNANFGVYDWNASFYNSSGVSIMDDTWHHIAFSFESGVANGSQLYVDGVAVGPSFTYTINAQTSDFVMAAGAPAGSQHLNGSLDEVRIWNTVRSESQINAFKDVELNGPEPGLIAYYDFSDGPNSGSVSDIKGGSSGALTNMDAPNDWIAATHGIAPAGPLDTTDPDVSITSSESDPTASSLFQVTITFTEEVAGFDLSDISVVNGTPSNLNTADNIVFTADIAPTAGGLVNVDVFSVVATDLTGNSNTSATTFTITYDVDPPTIIATSLSAARNRIYVEFDAGVYGAADGTTPVDAGDFTVNTTGGTASVIVNSLNVLSPSEIEFDITISGVPDGAEVVDVTPIATSVYDAVGNVMSIIQTANLVGLVDNSVLSFDGADDFVRIPTNAAFENQNYTVEAWVNIPNQPGGSESYAFVSKGTLISDGGLNRNGFTLLYGDLGGGIAVALGQFSSFDTEVVQFVTTLTPNTWYHVAGSYDGTTMRLFLDGVEVATNGALGANDVIYTGDNLDLKIGAMEGVSSDINNMPGMLDEVRIWNYARNAGQISALMDEEISGSQNGLVVYYDFNDAAGTTLTDIVAARNGTLDAAMDLVGTTGNWASGGTTLAPADATPPSITLAQDLQTIGTTLIGGTHDDNLAAIEVSLDGGSTRTPATNNGDGTWGYNMAIDPFFGGDGPYTLNIYALDAAENEGSVVGNLTVDLQNMLSFDGIDDYAEAPDAASLDITGALTLETWVFFNTAIDEEHPLITKWNPDASPEQRSYLLQVDNTSQVAFAVSTDGTTAAEGTNFSAVQVTYNFQVGRWYHVAATYEPSTFVRLYVNGELIGENVVNVMPSIFNSNSSLVLGANGNTVEVGVGSVNTGEAMEMDEVRIWSEAKTQADIQASITTELTGSELNLATYYDFNTASGTSITDRTTNANNATLNDNNNGVADGLIAGPFWSGSTVFDGDVLAPFFETGFPLIDNISETAFDITVQLNEEGQYFYVVVPDGATTPNVDDVRAGTGFGGTGQINAGNILVTTPATDFILNATGLSPSTDYDLYIVAQDDEGSPNVQAIANLYNVTTLAGPAPGAVSANLSLWLKADLGVTGTTQVSQWDDHSGGALNATQATAINQPALTDNALNYNPAISFDGSEDFMTSSFNINPSSAPDLTTILVFNSDQSATTPFRKVFGHDGGAFNRSIGLDSRAGTNFTFFAGSNSVVDYFNLTASEYYISTSEYTAANNFNGYINGLLENGPSSVLIADAQSTLTIGAISTAGSEPWDGDIAEMIMYSGTLSATDRQKIETYLAIKYGISIDQTAATNYVASDDNPIWDGTANATYNQSIAGIGRDDASQLDQKQSISADGRLSIALGTFAASNQANANAFANDLAYLVWGDNGLDLAFGARDIVNVPSGIDSRPSRIWRASEANSDVGNVTLRFDLNGEGYPGTYNPGNFKLMLDTDADFSTGAIELTADSYAGGIVEFNGVNIANGQFFTLGISEPPLPPTDFIVYNSSPTEITFEWTDNAFNETGYQILEADDYGFLSGIGVVANIAANSTLYTHTPVANKFYLAVPTNGFEDPSSQSSIEFATTDAFPGQALDFDGTGQYVSVADNDALSFGDGASDSPMSVEAWIFLDQITSRSVVSKRSGENEWHLVISSDGRVSVTLADQSSSGFLFGESPVIGFNTGEWYHIAFTYDGSSTAAGINTYVNGVLQAQNPSTSGSYTAMENTNSPVEIGTINSGASFNFDGQIDELKIWDFVKIDYTDRNASLDLSNANYPAGLVAYYPLDEGAGSNTVDRSRNTHDGVFVGGPTFVPSTASLTPPAAPTNLIAYATSTTAITLEWLDNATDETGYNVERDTDPLFSAPTIVGNSLPANTQAFVDNAGVDQRFYYRVQPTNGAENASSYSATEFGSTFSFPGQALSFDGSLDYISFNTPESYSSITIEAWINTVGGANQTIYTSYDGMNGFEFTINSANQLTFSIGDGVIGETVNSSEAITTGQWTHIAVSYNGSTATFYENGTALTTSGSLSLIPNDAGLAEYIGRSNSGTNFFSGELDEVKIWNNAKTDFTDRFSAAQGSEGNLVLYYPLDENTGTEVFDRSTTNHNGTITGAGSFVPSAVPLSLPGQVTNTNDTGGGSLRDAITYANANPGTTISFSIGESAPWVINLGSALPQIIAANTVIDASTQLGWIFGDPNAMVQINGSGIGGNANGINIDAADVEIYGLIITSFSGNFANGNIYLASNAADDAIIGSATKGNIIHGTGGNGIYVVDGDSAVIRGNRIGTLDGTTQSSIGNHGIATTGEIDYLIVGGDFFTGEGNTISGSGGYGMNLNGSGGGTGLSDVTIAGNRIGTSSNANTAIPNGSGGINLIGTVSAVTIGGVSPSDLNVISGNFNSGIEIQAGNTIDIEGNYIGIQSDGSSALGNVGVGIQIFASAINVNIGTSVQNIISENTIVGILFDGNSSSNTALGTNVFSCNGSGGIGYGSASPLTVAPTINNIGLTSATVSTTAADGSTVRIFFADDGCSNDQGIAFAGQGTVASGEAIVSGGFAPSAHYVAFVEDINGTSEFSAPFFTNFVLVTNTNDSGTGSFRAAIDSANTYPGTSIYFNIGGGGPYTIGVTTTLPDITGAGTIIDGTTQPGWVFGDVNNMVAIDGSAVAPNTSGIVVNEAANFEIYGMIVTGFVGLPAHAAIELAGDGADNAIIGAPNRGNIIHGGGTSGIYITNSDFATIQDNRIGTLDGNTASGNNHHGISVVGTVDNLTIGGNHASNEGNVISGAGNGRYGILSTAQGTNFVIQGNRIGTNEAGTASIFNEGGGVNIGGATSLTLGGANLGEENVISGNNSDANAAGVIIGTAPTGTIINNIIGLTADGLGNLGNGGAGIILNTNNGIVVTANIISGNAGDAITSNTGFSNSDIINNVIGLDVLMTNPFPNGAGIEFGTGTGNRIGYKDNPNTIAENTGAAIEISSTATENTFATNQIYNNGSGIILAAGANGDIAAPSIDAISTTDASGAGPEGATIHLYLGDGTGQGQMFLDSAIVSGGAWNIAGLSLTNGDELVATSTDYGVGVGTSTFSNASILSPPYPAAEGAGEALTFDGVDDFIEIPSLDVSGLNALTIEAWIKPNDIPNGPGNQYATIVGKGSYGAAGTNSASLYLFGSDGSPFSELRGRIDNGASVEEVTFDANNFNTGEWVHVAMTWNSGDPVNLYVNGELVDSSSPIFGPINSIGDNLTIGSSAQGGELLFEGEIDEVKIWDFEMPESSLREYLAEKVTNIHPAYANLLGYYRMDDSGDALNLQDFKGINNGTINGGSSYVLSGAHLGDESTYEYTYPVGSGRGIGTFSVENLGVANLPLHIYRINQTPTSNVVSGFNNIDDTEYYGVFSPGQTYDARDSVNGLTSDRRIMYRADGTDPTWTSISGPIGVDIGDEEINAFGQSGNGQFTTAIDQNPYPTPVDAGHAMSFDGVGDFIQGPDLTGEILNDFTFEAWVKTSASGPMNILSIGTNTTNQGIALKLRSTDQLSITPSGVNGPSSGVSNNDDQWHHVAGVYSGTDLRLYVDGVDLGSITTSLSIDYSQFRIGANAIDTSQPWNGDIDEVRLWNVALTETNIRDNMIGKLDSNSDSLNHLVAYYRFDENSGVTATNIGGDGDGTITGATPVISGAPQGQGSLYSYAAAPGILNTAQFGEDINVHYQDATGGIHAYVVQGNPNQLQAQGFNNLDQGKYYGVFAPGGQGVTIRMDYNNGGSSDPDRRIVYRTDATDDAAAGGWERLSGLINSDVTNDSIFAYNVPQGEISTATLNPPSSYPALSDINPGDALDFDGTDDQINLGNLGALSQTDAFTIEGWFNQTTLDQTRGMFIMRTDASNQIRARTWSDGNIYVYLHNGSTFNASFDYSAFVTAGNWFHFAMVFDGTGATDADRMKVYIDGVEVTLTYNGTVPSSTPDLSAATFLISEDTDADSDYWLGQMDEFRIWNASIASGDITAFANTTDISTHPNYSDMVAYYKFDDGTGSTILEDVFSNNDGMLVNMDENTDWVSSGALANAVLDPFITTWVTNDTQITIPTRGGSTYNYDVSWTNLTNPGVNEGSLSSQTGDAVLTGLQNTSTYQIEISGTFPVIYFNNGGDRDKIQTIEQWGDIIWETMADAFHGCTNLTYNAIDAPDLSLNTTLLRMFSEASSFNGNVSNWDVSNQTNFAGMFTNAIAFDQDLSAWNTGAATNMNGMFNGATSFNSPLNWDFSKVETATSMFAGATAFNQDLSSWVTDSLTTTFTMFSGAVSFNGDVSGWNVSDVTFMNNMFDGASAFDQDLGGWDVSGVTNMASMLDNTALSEANYDATLTGWSGQILQAGVNLGAAGLTYSAGALAARDVLTNVPNSWIITGDSQGISNFALDFDGTDDHAQVASPVGFPVGAAPRTLEFWFKSNVDLTSDTNHGIVQYGTNNTSQMFGLITSSNAAGKLYFFGFGDDLAGVTDLIQDQWYHAAVTYDGTDLNLYLDGNLEASKTSTLNTLMDVNGLTIGRRPGLENIWDGQLDEVRLWDHARSQTEIQNHMNNELFGNESGLVAYYPMSDGTGSTIVTDLTSGTNDASLVNMDENTDWIEGPSLAAPNPGSTFFEDFTDEPLPGTASSGPFLFSPGTWDGQGVLESGDIDARGGTGNAARVEPAGGNYIQTPPLDQATTFGFWYKGASTGGTYDVMASNDGIVYDVNMGSINPDPTYQEFTLDFTSNFDPSYTGAVRIVFNSGANALFIDDVSADVDILRGDVTLATLPTGDLNVNQGDTDVLIYKMSATISVTDVISEGLFLVPVGADSLDFTNTAFDFYQNIGTDDFGTATLLGTSSWSPGNPIPADAIGLLYNEAYSVGETIYLYVTADIRATANPVTFNIEQPIVDNFGYRDANKLDGGLAPGDNITILAGGDVTAPTVVNLTPSLGTIIDSDTQFELVVEFDENMDTGVDPTIIFPIEDPSTTLALNSGVWDDALHFRATYGITDVNVELLNIDVQIIGSQDLAGNAMNIYNGPDAFNIDTENPTVTVETYGTSITSPQLTGNVDDVNALVSVDVDGSNYPATNNADGTWTLAAGQITNLADGTYDVIATATDASGNTGTDGTTDELIISQSVVTLPAEDVTSTSFTARWSEGLDVQTYQVDVSEVADFSTFVSGFQGLQINATGVVVSNLDFSTQYYYRVRLVNTASQVSANSNTAQVKTSIDLETEADSLALVQVFNAVAPQGLNWGTERLRNWDGVTLDISRTRVEVVDISGTSAAGDMPNPFTGNALTNGGLSNMLEMNASGNQITGLMDFSATAITSLNVSGNSLEFNDLEPVTGITTVDYSNQASIQYNEAAAAAIEVRYTTDYSLSVTTGGSSNVYTWFRNDVQISSGSDFIVNNGVNVILAIDYDNMGTFRTEITNPLVPGLTIDVDPQDVLAIADMQVTVSDASGNPLTSPLDGFMLETTPIATGFPVLETIEDVNASTFTFPDVVLGDYIIQVESDLSLYIPTYFGNVFEWTEADTLFFRSDDVIEMTMTEVPTPLGPGDGDGSLAVLIEEDFDGTGGRIDARRRASKRKCGLRRKRSGGRTGQEDEFDLIAYGETDDNGEFQFGFLPQGTYRFFVEYPGIPINESSFVQFDVGEAGISDTDFKLQAFATEDGIEVNIEVVLGIILEYFKDLEIFPNPSSSYLNIKYRHLKSGDVTAQLVDLAGNTKWSEDLRNGYDGQLRIDVSDFQEGIYILRFYDRNSPQENMVSFRVIVKD